MKNISNLLSDPKSRMVFVLTMIIFIAMIVWGFLRFSGSSTAQTSANASVTDIPDIKSTPNPDQQLSPNMVQNIKASDKQRLSSAQSSGSSALPTLLPQSQEAQPLPQNSSQDSKDGKADGSNNKNGAKDGNNANGQLSAEQLAAINDQLAQSQQALVDAQAQLIQQQIAEQQQALAEAKKNQQQLTQSMSNQGQALLANWAGEQGTPKQSYVTGQLAEDNPKNGKNSKNSNSSTTTVGMKNEDLMSGPQQNSTEKEKSPATIKAGDIMFAVLRTEVNSDQPGPILATIVSGKFRGAKIVGSMQKLPEITGTNGPDSVILSFKSMSIKDLPASVSINAVAIDPDTARTAIASSVDHHRLYRYGTLFASSFLSGYGSAISSSGSVVLNNTDGSQTTFQQELNPTETFLSALGEVGTQVGDALSDAIDRPNTIVVNAGISLGLLFLDDVTINDLTG